MAKETIHSRNRRAVMDPDQTQLAGRRNYQKYINAKWRVEANEKLHQMRKVWEDPQRGQQEVQVAPENDAQHTEKKEAQP